MTVEASNSRWRALPVWSIAFPLLGLAAVLLPLKSLGIAGTLAAIVILIGSVIAAVHHAEVVAHRVGEPFGTLVLAVAVTVIEVSLIVSLMLTGGADAASLARDTVFAAIMLILNGIVGLCLLAGGLRHHEQRFTLRGSARRSACWRRWRCCRWCFPTIRRARRLLPTPPPSSCSSRSSPSFSTARS